MEGEVNHERLWTLKNNLRVLKGRGVGGWGNQVVGIRRAQIAWSTGCGEKTMNTVTLKINKKFLKNAEACILLIFYNLSDVNS